MNKSGFTSKKIVSKEPFEEYRSKKAEIKELEYKLVNSGDMDLKQRESYVKSIEKLKKECNQIEEIIESIADSQLRRMLRMKYIEGMSLYTIGTKAYLDKSTVSRKISGFFKVATQETNATL